MQRCPKKDRGATRETPKGVALEKESRIKGTSQLSRGLGHGENPTAPVTLMLDQKEKYDKIKPHKNRR